MSRIGKKPVIIPANVTVTIADGNVVTVKGPKGTLTHTFHPDMILKIEGNELIVDRPDDEHLHKSLHGLTRTLIHNMVEGVEKGFTKELEVNGVGYRAEKKGNQLVMRLGFSHEVFVDEIPGITIEVPAPNKIIIHGIDKQTVGQFAAEVPEGSARSVALQLLPECRKVFSGYTLSDDFMFSPEFERLYDELTGMVVIWLEENGL